LLRLIGGVGRPDTGRIDVHGRIGAITELGTGFNAELTGRESVMVAGVIAGLTRKQVRARFGDIVAFAELEDFVDEPVRTYSSGMVARLAFALATHVDAEVLLVDEVLAVGDISFQRRCIDRLKEFQRAGVTMVIVSHDPHMLTDLCDEVIWLRAGRVMTTGPPHEIAARYEAAMAEKTRSLTPADVPDAVTPSGLRLRIQENRFGSQEARITTVRVLDLFGEPQQQIRSGEAVALVFESCVPPELNEVHLGVHLIRSDGVMCLDLHTTLHARAPDDERRSCRLQIDRLDLAGGDYAFDVGIYSSDWERPYDYHWRAYPLRVVGPHGGAGALAPPIAWSFPSSPAG
jgi:lipopolysaccharide transport system ATP-binding protein